MDHLHGLVDDRCVAEVGVLPPRSLPIDQISSHFDSDAFISLPVGTSSASTLRPPSGDKIDM